MPIFGTLDIGPILEGAPRMSGLDGDPWEIQGVDILQLTFEIDDGNMTELLPQALHPTIPPIAIFSVARFPESPVGPFHLAQVRIGCRAGVRPRGYLLMAYSDSEEAATVLGERWGYTCRHADVRLHQYHDLITASVTAGGAEILHASLVGPEPISGADIQYVANMNLARLPGEDGNKAVLVQVDPEYRFHRAQRGRPEITVFTPAAWFAEGVDLVYPVVASFAQADTGFPRIRYVLNPDVPALQGTRKIG